ncbi:hypothetical protein KR018_008478, partial [Drosophila ironensis]
EPAPIAPAAAPNAVPAATLEPASADAPEPAALAAPDPAPSAEPDESIPEASVSVETTAIVPDIEQPSATAEAAVEETPAIEVASPQIPTPIEASPPPDAGSIPVAKITPLLRDLHTTDVSLLAIAATLDAIGEKLKDQKARNQQVMDRLCEIEKILGPPKD